MIMLAKGLTLYSGYDRRYAVRLLIFFMKDTFLWYHWYLGKGPQLGGEDLDSSLAVEPEQVIKFLKTLFL